LFVAILLTRLRWELVLSDIYIKPTQEGWPEFKQKSPVKVKDLQGTRIDAFNDLLENDIRESGDRLNHKTAAKCHMTRWDMDKEYESFKKLGELVISLAKTVPLANATNESGDPRQYDYKVADSWGLIYTKGQTTKSHQHWPHTWSFTYCVRGCEECAPLVFPDAYYRNDPSGGGGFTQVKPKGSQLVLWPAWLYHSVPEQKCEHERIMAVGNLVVDWEKSIIPVTEHSLTPAPKGE